MSSYNTSLFVPASEPVQVTPLLVQISAGSVGAIITALTLTPVDVVKTRLQVSSSKCMNYACMEEMCLANTCTATPPRSRTFHVLKFIAINEGVRSLWSGLKPTLVMSIPTIAIYMTAYDRLKSFLDKVNRKQYSFLSPLIAGCLARTCAVVVTSPLELIRTRIQGQSNRSGVSKSIGKTMVKGIKNSGFSYLFHGLAPNLLRDVPFSGLYWILLENSKKVCLAYSNSRGGEGDSSDNIVTVNFISGCLAGGVTAAVTTPLDVIKTKSSMQSKPSVREAFREIIAEEGMKGFFRGIVPRVVKVAPSCALVITTYEFVKSVLTSSPAI